MSLFSVHIIWDMERFTSILVNREHWMGMNFRKYCDRQICSGQREMSTVLSWVGTSSSLFLIYVLIYGLPALSA